MRRGAAFVYCAALALLAATAARGQVSPVEILNPQLKASELAYLHQLQALNLDIQSIRLPFPFHLARYVNLDPKDQPAMDTRGVEFVKFHDRVVLKITGIYGAAFSAEMLTQNQRASRVFEDVIAPLLKILPRDIPANVTCDAVGFEIGYHARTHRGSYDYEGKEILVAVLDKEDAFAFSNLARPSDRQDVLDRSDIYLSGKPFGLALDERDAFPVEALERSDAHKESRAAAAQARPAKASPNALDLKADPPIPASAQPVGPGGPPAPANRGDLPTAPSPEPPPPSAVGPARTIVAPPQPPATGLLTQADADRLQVHYQSQLDALAKQGAAQFHLVDYAPPSFVVFRGKIFVQLTLRDPLEFRPDSTSIYKRAARAFDIFLAPQLKPLLDKIPAGPGIEGLDITVLNQFASRVVGPLPEGQDSSEADEFICPLKATRQFVDAEITNQDLINQSVVLVNAVRISLDLQRVE